jgi:hypothetical protein
MSAKLSPKNKFGDSFDFFGISTTATAKIIYFTDRLIMTRF